MGLPLIGRVWGKTIIYLLMAFIPAGGAFNSAWGWPQPDGLELSKKTGAQTNPVLAVNTTGTWLAAWLDDSLGAAQVMVQNLNDNGTPLWDSNGIQAGFSQSSQADPVICGDGNGGAYLAWTDYRLGAAASLIYAQHLNSEGSTLWTPEGIPVCTGGYNQSGPGMIPDGEGGILLAWVDQRNVNNDIYAQRLNSEGTTLWNKSGIPIIKYTGSQTELKMAPGSEGSAYVVWSDTRSGNKDIYLQKISRDGTLFYSSSGYSICVQPLIQQNPRIISDREGGVFLAWEDGRKGFYDIYTQKIGPSGTASWTPHGLAICTAANQQYSPVMALCSSSTLVMAWTDRRSGGYQIYMQSLDMAGTILWENNGRVLSQLTTSQQMPRVAEDGGGGFYLAWLDSRSINLDLYAQHYSAAGEPNWQIDGIPIAARSGEVGNPCLLSDSGTGLLLAWEDNRNLTAPDIYIQKVPLSGRLESGIPPELFEQFGK